MQSESSARLQLLRQRHLFGSPYKHVASSDLYSKVRPAPLRHSSLHALPVMSHLFMALLP